MNTIETIDNSPFRHLISTIGELPTSFTESMSYYEMLAWLCDFIEKKVVPAVNINAEALKELRDYVEHYFDNLDVQEEINNKLDAMAESGQLAEIIAAYLNTNAVFCFNSVAAMKAAENIIEGMFVKTLAYYNGTGKGGAYYKVTTQNPSVYQEALQGGLYATLITSVVDLDMFGCAGDNTTDDTEAFQAAVSYAVANGLDIIGNGDYKLSDTITFDHTYGKKITINAIHTSSLGNKPLFYFDHGRYDTIRINSITGEKITVPNITNTYEHQSAFLLEGTTLENIDIQKIENLVCGFTLYSTGSSGAEGSYYNRISCKKCDTFYMTHLFGYNGCINGNTFTDTLHYITEWTNSSNYDQFTVINESTGTSPVYVNNHNEFRGIMVEKIVEDSVDYVVADLSDSNSFIIDIDRIEVAGNFNLSKIAEYNTQSGYNLIKFNSGWFTVPTAKALQGNNNLIVSFNNYKYGLERPLLYDNDGATLTSANFEYISGSGIADGHIIVNPLERKARINGVFKAKTALSGFSNIDFCHLNFKPVNNQYGVGLVYLVDNANMNSIELVGSIKQKYDSYECDVRFTKNIAQDDMLFVDFNTMEQ